MALVEQVQAWWRSMGVDDARSCVVALGWQLRLQRFDAAAGGLQALLIPRAAGGFSVVVDPDPTPEQAAAGLSSGDVVTFRVAHEYAHTFFYLPTAVPSRPRPATLREERFCDAFARAVTGVSARSVSDERPRVYGGRSSRDVA